VRLYHPNLKPPANEFVTESDDELHLQVYFDAGWEKAPEPEKVPGYEPEPVTYAPVTKPAAKATKSTAKDTDK
jgi:hypothetical protein